MTDPSVLPVDRLVLGYSAWEWPFAHEHRREIDRHFAKLQRAKPALYNGRVLMLRDYALDARVFRGRWFETDFASLLAWRDWGFPDRTVNNSFAMGALRGSDGGFLLGEMGAHTANAGKIYFPAGTPEPEDVTRGSVDLLSNVMREVAEETGLRPSDLRPRPGWFTVQAGPRVAQMKLLQTAVPAAELRERIVSFLATQEQPELAEIHIVHSLTDLTDAMPPFVTAFLRHVWKEK
jgi:8-oxo-dGTP pyrophosphatase MutT (NUDIX family)